MAGHLLDFWLRFSGATRFRRAGVYQTLKNDRCAEDSEYIDFNWCFRGGLPPVFSLKTRLRRFDIVKSAELLPTTWSAGDQVRPDVSTLRTP